MTIRKVITVPGREHTHAPIPEGVVIGDLLFSSLLAPMEQGDPDVEAASLFQRIRGLVEAAGGTPDHILDMAVYVLDDVHRENINQAWIKLFPDPNDRPSRHILNVAPQGIRPRFTATFTAIVPGDGPPGRLVYSPLLSGRVPATNELPGEPARQAESMFQQIKQFVEKAGGTTDNIANLMVYVMDEAYRELVNVEWRKMFPDRDDLPTRQMLNALPAGLGDDRFGCIVTAVV